MKRNADRTGEREGKEIDRKREKREKRDIESDISIEREREKVHKYISDYKDSERNAFIERWFLHRWRG